jgi:hypothetical protein
MKDMIRKIISADTPESSKRFFGGIGFVVFLVYVGVFDHTLIDTLGYLSVSLLGFTSIEKIYGLKK